MGRKVKAVRRRLPASPSVAELAELVRRLAVDAPGLLPAFLWCVCRSTRATKACREHGVRGADLAALRAYPAGAQLIAASKRGVAWLRRWIETEEALDELLPPLTMGGPPDVE